MDKILIDKDGIVYGLQKTGKGILFAYIRTKNDKKFKHIGTIDLKEKTYIKDMFNTIFFRKMKSIGFPYYLIKALVEHGAIDTLKVNLPDRTLKISAEKALKEGNFINYKKKGYELQIHIPIDKFEEE